MTHASRFDWMERLSDEDFTLACDIIGGQRAPDLVIAPDGNPYIYRFHLARTPKASVYFHIQVASDPKRPPHDHPFDNTSVILSGGYNETWHRVYQKGNRQFLGTQFFRELRPGDMVPRKATDAHRLVIPDGIPYSMSLFSCGPVVREWGFWYEDGWRSHKTVTHLVDGRSVHIEPEDDHD